MKATLVMFLEASMEDSTKEGDELMRTGAERANDNSGTKQPTNKAVVRAFGVIAVLVVPEFFVGWGPFGELANGRLGMTTQNWREGETTVARTKAELIMTDTDSVQASSRSPKPNSDLKSLDRLVGTWRLSGEAQGQIRYEWTQGGFFLVQHFDFEHGGRKIKGIEVIGHLQGLAGEPSKEIRSRVYSFLDGLTLDYVYELVGDTLTIWGGEKGSPAYYKGTFSKEGNILSGAWVWPGGGYQCTATRVKRKNSAFETKGQTQALRKSHPWR